MGKIDKVDKKKHQECQLKYAGTNANTFFVENMHSRFHAINIGHLSKRASEPAFIPCTPKGVIELIKSTGVAMSGKKAVVVGRSDIVVSFSYCMTFLSVATPSETFS